jgi:hypothetical protein
MTKSTDEVDLGPLNDFRVLLDLIWQHLNLRGGPTPVQYDIAHYLQHGPRRAVIEAFRGVGKSWVTSAFVIWSLLKNPQLNILVVSASKIRADDFTTFTMRLINEIDILAHLRPNADQRNSKVSFDVGPARASHAPSVKSVGITGQLAGSRADLLIADDIEVPNNAATQAMRDKLSEAVKEFDAVLKPGGRIIYLGTPQTEQSLYNKLPERGYQIRVWPALYPTPEQLPNYGENLAPLIADTLERQPDLAGRAVDRKRFSDVDLMERMASYGRSGFALQFMLDTRLSDADRYPLRLSDLLVMNLNPDRAPSHVVWATSPELAINDLPCVGIASDRYYRPMSLADEWLPYQGTVMAIDPSGKGKDETGYAIVSMLHGVQYLRASGGFRDGYGDATMEALAKLAKEFGVRHIRIEQNFGGGMFAALFKPWLQKVGYPCVVEEETSSSQKEKRIIDVLEPVLNQHRLVVDHRVILRDFKSTEDLPAEDANRYRLFYQLTRITKDKGALARDDRLDALAMAVAYWVEQMSKATMEAHEEAMERLKKQQVEDFIRSAMGGRGDEAWGYATMLDLP